MRGDQDDPPYTSQWEWLNYYRNPCSGAVVYQL